jgi:hypothetical protein
LEDRRFSDGEVREILKKAVQKPPSRSLSRREGLSLAELKSIGEEVGIDPARLEDAARSVAERKTSAPSRLLGGPTVLDFERKVQGVFQPDDTPEILSLVRRIMGHQGEVDEIHGSLEWQVKGETGNRYVTLTPRDGTTTIRSSANLSNLAVLTFLPAGVMGAMAPIIGLIKFFKDGSEVALIVGIAVLAVLYPVLRTIFSRVSTAEAGRLEEVVDELARRIGESGE